MYVCMYMCVYVFVIAHESHAMFSWYDLAFLHVASFKMPQLSDSLISKEKKHKLYIFSLFYVIEVHHIIHAST